MARKKRQRTDYNLAEFKIRVGKFQKKLADPDAPVFNPIKELRLDVLRIPVPTAAGLFGSGIRQYYYAESGGLVSVPEPVLALVVKILGTAVREDFERAWERYRKSLSALVLEMIDHALSSPDPGGVAL